jgi:hypothetical protein
MNAVTQTKQALQAATAAPVVGSGCHGGRETMREAALAARKSETLERLQKDYPQGPHDQPQSMCPAFGSLAWACGCARGDHPLRQRLLRLRPDLHEPLLRRAPHRRLRAVQLRDARHRQAVRGHPRRCAPDGEARGVRRRSSSPISACRPPPACRSTCCRRRSTAFGSSASTCPASACPPMPRRRTCSPARCSAMRARKPRPGPVARPRDLVEGAARWRCSARCSRPIRRLIGALLAPMGLALAPS